MTLKDQVRYNIVKSIEPYIHLSVIKVENLTSFKVQNQLEKLSIESVEEHICMELWKGVKNKN